MLPGMCGIRKVRFLILLFIIAVVVYSGGAGDMVSAIAGQRAYDKPKINRAVLNEIKRARLTGSYGDLTDKPVACDCEERTHDQITQIVIHSTHVGISFPKVIHNSLTSCGFAHYYIDRDGTVIQRVKDLRAAPHTRSTDGAVNQSSIGIELYSTTTQERSPEPFTLRQQEALVSLTIKLMNTYHIPADRIFRHADYSPHVDCSTIPKSYNGNCREYVNDHQDPYGWTDRDWKKFLDRLRPVAVKQDIARDISH